MAILKEKLIYILVIRTQSGNNVRSRLQTETLIMKAHVIPS